jgi:hypothetical protein
MLALDTSRATCHEFCRGDEDGKQLWAAQRIVALMPPCPVLRLYAAMQEKSPIWLRIFSLCHVIAMDVQVQ